MVFNNIFNIKPNKFFISLLCIIYIIKEIDQTDRKQKRLFRDGGRGDNGLKTFHPNNDNFINHHKNLYKNITFILKLFYLMFKTSNVHFHFCIYYFTSNYVIYQVSKINLKNCNKMLNLCTDTLHFIYFL